MTYTKAEHSKERYAPQPGRKTRVYASLSRMAHSKGKPPTILGEKGRDERQEEPTIVGQLLRKRDVRKCLPGRLPAVGLFHSWCHSESERKQKLQRNGKKQHNWIYSADLHAQGVLIPHSPGEHIELDHWVLAPIGIQREKCKVPQLNDTIQVCILIVDAAPPGLATVLLCDTSPVHLPLLPWMSANCFLSDWPALWCTAEDHQHIVRCSIQGLAVTTWKRKDMWVSSSSQLGTAAWLQEGEKTSKQSLSTGN